MNAVPSSTATTSAVVSSQIGRPDETRPTLHDDPELLVEDLLVEEVSIDGMCGVY